MRSSPRDGALHGTSKGAAATTSSHETTELVDRIASLAADAATAADLRRPGMAGAINALLARLPGEAASDETAARLLGLLDEGHLEGLVDEEGEPSGVAATRALLGLGYPHALLVPPARLEALRRATRSRARRLASTSLAVPAPAARRWWGCRARRRGQAPPGPLPARR